jgi:hypothetical protein
MYSGKIAVPPGGGGLKNYTIWFDLKFSLYHKHNFIGTKSTTLSTRAIDKTF